MTGPTVERIMELLTGRPEVPATVEERDACASFVAGRPTTYSGFIKEVTRAGEFYRGERLTHDKRGHEIPPSDALRKYCKETGTPFSHMKGLISAQEVDYVKRGRADPSHELNVQERKETSFQATRHDRTAPERWPGEKNARDGREPWRGETSTKANVDRQFDNPDVARAQARETDDNLHTRMERETRNSDSLRAELEVAYDDAGNYGD